MVFAIELWGLIAGHLRRGELLPMLLVDRTRALVAERFIYRKLSLRHNSDGRLALLKPRVALALFAYLASPRGRHAALTVQDIDAVWTTEQDNLEVSKMLCDALVQLDNLRVLRTSTSVDRYDLERLLAFHLWPELRKVYIDSAEAPRSFITRHPRLEAFRACLGVRPDGHPRTIGATCLSSVCVTDYAECEYVFAVQQPALVRVDVMSQLAMPAALSLVLNRSPSIRQLNFAWTESFDVDRMLTEVALPVRQQIASVGVWIFPVSDLAYLTGVNTEADAVTQILRQLDAVFPSLSHLSIQYIGVFQDSYRDQLAISQKVASTFRRLLSDMCTSNGDLSSLRHVFLGQAITLHCNARSELFQFHLQSQPVIADPMYAGW